VIPLPVATFQAFLDATLFTRARGSSSSSSVRPLHAIKIVGRVTTIAADTEFVLVVTTFRARADAAVFTSASNAVEIVFRDTTIAADAVVCEGPFHVYATSVAFLGAAPFTHVRYAFEKSDRFTTIAAKVATVIVATFRA